MNIVLKVGNLPSDHQFSLNWKLDDSCYGPKDSVVYEANSMYLDRCCLIPGIYTLTCRNDVEPFGWAGSFIEILGQRYCDDFVGFKGLRKIIVSGKFEEILV